jgi:hypothetical protein
VWPDGGDGVIAVIRDVGAVILAADGINDLVPT